MPSRVLQALILITLFLFRASAATLYVDAGNPTPASPFSTWATAATNIQDAIDASTAGDTVLVTNGIYASGGKAVVSDLTNRVVLDKPITVQSVNGFSATTILGSVTALGPQAIRCAWLTNGASLVGFTLRGGATRNSGDSVTLGSGGGAWCASSNALVANCVIRSNLAFNMGAGVYQGTVQSCLLIANNSSIAGGGAHSAVLQNCTVISNSTGTVNGRLTNCIVYFNTSTAASGGIYSYCCCNSALSGVGNITSDPQLLPDGLHLSPSSPCRFVGINISGASDIFARAWSNPPSMGCTEWDPAPILASPPRFQLTGNPPGFIVRLAASSPTPVACAWTHNGTPVQNDGHFSAAGTTNLAATGFLFSDAGNYQAVVSNAFGMSTSAVATLVIHCVDPGAPSPLSPFTNWTTAATNIQDAIDAALAGDVILVTNGLYATGGRVADGALTNRVVINKAVTIQSLSGPDFTIIQGQWTSGTTNGASAVRCVWMTNNTVLSGFTLRGGATAPATGSLVQDQNGGGVAATTNGAMVFNCKLTNNAAGVLGGGAYRASLVKSLLVGNMAIGSSISSAGGGASSSSLTNCVLKLNYAGNRGGGASVSILQGCAVIGNAANMNGGGTFSGSLYNCNVCSNQLVGNTSSDAGVSSSIAVNCIIVGNTIIFGNQANYATPPNFTSCCTFPLPAGSGNIAADPQLLSDGIHISSTSPCRASGTNSVVNGLDIDSQPWSNSPSIGCDEWQPAPVVASGPTFEISPPDHSFRVKSLVTGQDPITCFWIKDGSGVQTGQHYNSANSPTLVINDLGPADSGSYFVVASNTFGMSTSQVAQVVLHGVDANSANPTPPYSAWATAATTIQDAIDVAQPGEYVVVTNGIYSTGGRIVSGDLSNRVVLDKALMVLSVNGASATLIEGTWDPVATNGPTAVRCAWLTNGANLVGFTLFNGATRTNGDQTSLQNGGGVWGASAGLITSCVVTGNAAAAFGGGVYQCTVKGSAVTGNFAPVGGGIANARAYSSSISLNTATNLGGGAYLSFATNCVFFQNFSISVGPGAYSGGGANNIFYGNYARYGGSAETISGSHTYSCFGSAIGRPSGTGNFTADPRLLDLFHVTVDSPCAAAGSALFASGQDVDGENWASPPAIGCDQPLPAGLVGPLQVGFSYVQTNPLVNHYGFLNGWVSGRAARVQWSFGDSTVVTNTGINTAHIWTNAGDYTVVLTAYNNDNPAGVSTNILIHVQPIIPVVLTSPAISSNVFMIQFDTQNGATYYLQLATNLTPPITWTTVQTIYGTGSHLQVVDSLRTNTPVFYRVSAN